MNLLYQIEATSGALNKNVIVQTINNERYYHLIDYLKDMLEETKGKEKS